MRNIKESLLTVSVYLSFWPDDSNYNSPNSSIIIFLRNCGCKLNIFSEFGSFSTGAWTIDSFCDSE